MEYSTILNRHSVRQYTDAPIETEKIERLNALIDDINAHSHLNFQLVVNEPNAFGRSIMAKYGKFNGVRNYICMVGDSKVDGTPQAVGYHGERLVLLAQELGMNTCWVGLTFSTKNVACDIAKQNERLYAVIAIGYGATQGAPHKSKTPKDICSDIDKMPAWFVRGVEYALLAPTSMNTQKFSFKLNGTKVTARHGFGPYTAIDLGIAMYHFELGAGKENFEWAEKMF